MEVARGPGNMLPRAAPGNTQQCQVRHSLRPRSPRAGTYATHFSGASLIIPDRLPYYAKAHAKTIEFIAPDLRPGNHQAPDGTIHAAHC